MDDFNYIVVGAGSAGCVLASRLTEDGKSRVLLLEFGGSDRSVLIQMPAALSIPMNMPKYNWGFITEPEPHLGGRQLVTPRGKVLGGSSSINGMVWVRGNPLDFDGWEKQGAEGWDYRHVLPYFRRADAHEGGDPQYRGSDGPLYNSYGRLGKSAAPCLAAGGTAGWLPGYVRLQRLPAGGIRTLHHVGAPGTALEHRQCLSAPGRCSGGTCAF